jgi:hypothetical protein
MDIGKQQRVIIVEVDASLAHPASAGEPDPFEEPTQAAVVPGPGGAWPLPLDLDAEFELVPADRSAAAG